VEIVRLILAVALPVTALGLMIGFAVPASVRIMEVAAALFALATWIAPPIILVMPRSRKPASSLASVGRTIGVFVIAACLSTTGLSLALVSFVFARGGWAWFAVLAIAAFWLSGALWIRVAGRRSRRTSSSARID
jgi:hypothetical protein